jgi:hypothetical protein
LAIVGTLAALRRADGGSPVLAFDLHVLVQMLRDPPSIVGRRGPTSTYRRNPHVPRACAPTIRVLKSRKIHRTSNINEYTAKEVATRLFYLNAVDPQPADRPVSRRRRAAGWTAPSPSSTPWR